MALSLEELQNRIGYQFHNRQLLERAVTHSSYAFETGEKNHHLHCNERLEFLGDTVLSLLSSEYLYRRYPALSEGELTRMRSAIVCEGALARYAEQIGLGEFLLFGKGESAGGGAKKPAILADAFEAILAAIYLDAAENGMKAASVFLDRFLSKAADELSPGRIDSKSLLQVFLQKDGDLPPDYRVVEETGPDHAKRFTVEVYLDSNRIGRGTGTSKRHAEQEAAADALRLFGVDR